MVEFLSSFVVQFGGLFVGKNKKTNKNQDKALEEDGGLVAPDGMSVFIFC